MVDLALARYRRPSPRRLVNAWVALTLVAAVIDAAIWTGFHLYGGL